MGFVLSVNWVVRYKPTTPGGQNNYKRRVGGYLPDLLKKPMDLAVSPPPAAYIVSAVGAAVSVNLFCVRGVRLAGSFPLHARRPDVD